MNTEGTTYPHKLIPPEPPDPMSIEIPNNTTTEIPKDSFRDKLMNKNINLNKSYNHYTNKSPILYAEEGETIQLTEEEKLRIYRPWQYSVLMKLVNKKLTYNYLRTKLAELWKPMEPLLLIDLGCDYYVAKFNNPENATKVLHGGSWFITRNFLSVRQWEPNFVPEEATQKHTAIWL
ncbi:hypothetical protein FXO38_11909 [Capsicum annuum]|nr:hypothetical protein FXO37_36286 [Capsicum annuum]KAF3661018.1 hypothetical protein FXO38_11909 [Capsicum annuum]